MTLVMILLIAAFALWGVGDYFTQSSNDTIATVNGEIISFTEFNNQFANQRQQMMAQYGEGLDPSVFDSPIMRRNTLESMINSELVRQVAQNNGYTVTAEEIRRTIEEAPAFKDENGVFDKTLYAAWLSQTNQSAQLLQMKIADEQAGQALNGIFASSAFITPFEERKMAQLNKQTRDIEYITISPSDFVDQSAITDEEISAYFDENSTQYMTDEMISVNYIELKADDVAQSIEITEAEALEYFENNKNSYRQDEQRLASHILLNNDDSSADILAEIQDKLAAGEDFAELAKTYSQDPGSGSAGGDLGWVSPGDMVEEFDEALFAMEVNTVSDAVETQFGIHLIQLNEIKAESTPVYEAVKADIITALQAQDAETMFLDQASQLSEAVLDAQSGLEEVAESMGYEMKTTELFARTGGQDIASNVEFIKAAFSSTVKDELMNSDLINLSDTHVAFVHLNEIKDAELKALDEVKASIELVLKDQKANEAASALAQTMVDVYSENEQTLAEVATAYEVEVQTAEAVTRVGSSLPFNLVKEVFALSRPVEGSKNAYVLSGNGNDSVVVNLLAVNDVDLETLEDLAAEGIQLSRNIRNNEQQLLIQALRESASITINENMLDQSSNF